MKAGDTFLEIAVLALNTQPTTMCQWVKCWGIPRPRKGLVKRGRAGVQLSREAWQLAQGREAQMGSSLGT